MSFTCFIQNCKEFPTSYCSCQSPPVYFCSGHLSSHNLSTKKHHEIVTYAQTITLSGFSPLSTSIISHLSTLTKTETSLILQSTKTIKKIQSECEKALKKISEAKLVLSQFLTNTLKSSVLLFDQKKNAEKILSENFKSSLKKITKIFDFVENKFDKKNPENAPKVNSRILCLECKISYFYQCGVHLLCPNCRICYCQSCKVSANYATEDQKGQKLTIEKDPVRISCDLENIISTCIHNGYNNTLNIPVSITRIIGKTAGFAVFNLNIMKFLSKKLPWFIWINGSNVKSNEVTIVTEYCTNTLSEITHEILPLTQLKLIAKGLIEGFAYMAFYKIYHRNISMNSILLTEDFKPKIYDFSLATLHSTDITSGKISLGTLAQGKDGFLSPERHRFIVDYKEKRKVVPYNIEKSDVFSLGLILLSLFTQFKCVYSLQTCEDFEVVKEKTRKIENKELGKVVKRMLHPDPAARPYFCEVLEEFNKVNFKDCSL